MLSDPQSITYDSVAYSCPRVGNTDNTAKYQDVTGTITISTGQQTTKGSRKRSVVTVRHRKVAANPFDSSLNAEYSASISLTLNEPVVGYTQAEKVLLIDAVLDYLRASTDAVPAAIAGGQI